MRACNFIVSSKRLNQYQNYKFMDNEIWNGFTCMEVIDDVSKKVFIKLD